MKKVNTFLCKRNICGFEPRSTPLRQFLQHLFGKNEKTAVLGDGYFDCKSIFWFKSKRHSYAVSPLARQKPFPLVSRCFLFFTKYKRQIFLRSVGRRYFGL